MKPSQPPGRPSSFRSLGEVGLRPGDSEGFALRGPSMNRKFRLTFLKRISKMGSCAYQDNIFASLLDPARASICLGLRAAGSNKEAFSFPLTHPCLISNNGGHSVRFPSTRIRGTSDGINQPAPRALGRATPTDGVNQGGPLRGPAKAVTIARSAGERRPGKIRNHSKSEIRRNPSALGLALPPSGVPG